jgi:septal ring factor EnvC (AmiA/AmiB activator)
VNLSDLTPQSLLTKVIAWLAVIAVVVASLWATANHYENIGYDKRKAEDMVQLNKDLIAAKNQTAVLQSKVDKASYDLAQTKMALANTSATNRDLSNRLREQLTAFNAGLSNDSKQTLIARINTLSDVLSECTSRYTEVATKADSYAADSKMMQESWPK